MKDKLSTNKEGQVNDMKSYYAFQAKIYDATRWTFLYGRNTILHKIPFPKTQRIKVLEVGCGTGVNILKMAQMFPNAQFTGLDVSGDMLDRARINLDKYQKRVTLLEEPYQESTKFNGQFDVILFSYALTMINPQWIELLDQAPKDLKPDGVVAVVDFHDANFDFYRQFMRGNHVKLNGHILPVLEEKFDTQYSKVKIGLAGVWSYMMYVGKKK